MARTMKKLDSKLHKQQQGWPKISNTARKYYKDENLENTTKMKIWKIRQRNSNVRASTFWVMIG